MEISTMQIMADENYLKNALLLLKNTMINILSDKPCYNMFVTNYTYVYHIISSNNGKFLYMEVRNMVSNYLKNKVEIDLKNHANDSFLEHVDSLWNRHQRAMLLIEKVFLYMDNTFVVCERKQTLRTFTLQVFRDMVIQTPTMENLLSDNLATMISNDRAGKTNNRSIIRNICHMLMAVGMGVRDIYEQVFETRFLKNTTNYYSIDSKLFLEKNSIAAYMEKIDADLKDEIDRVRHCLHSSTESRIVTLLEEVLIKTHIHTIVEREDSGMRLMLEQNEFSQLRHMYRLLRQVSGGVNLMAECFNKFLRENTLKNLSRLEQDGSVQQSKPSARGIAFVPKLVEAKESAEKFLKISFNSDPIFRIALNSAFEYLLNTNPQSPEYMSLYLHKKMLKKSKISESDFETLVNQFVMLFRFLYAKDIFKHYYCQHFAKRLLYNKSTSQPWELVIIHKLQNECGYSYSYKIEYMLKDIAKSLDLSQQFKKEENNLKELELNVYVINPELWPVVGALCCNIPQEVGRAFEQYQSFYKSQSNFKRRHLKMDCTLCKAEVTAYFYDLESSQLEARNSEGESTNWGVSKLKKYTLHVSGFHACVLMLFNNVENLTYKEIAEATQIPDCYLMRTLQSMSLGKREQLVLIKEPLSKDIKPSHTFTVNNNFYHKGRCVRIQQLALRLDREAEQREKMIPLVKVDRQYEIQCAIMRVMKQNKTLEYSTLVELVIRQLQRRFLPSHADIKKYTNVLVCKDYLKRSTESSMIYEYIP